MKLLLEPTEPRAHNIEMRVISTAAVAGAVLACCHGGCVVEKVLRNMYSDNTLSLSAALFVIEMFAFWNNVPSSPPPSWCVHKRGSFVCSIPLCVVFRRYVFICLPFQGFCLAFLCTSQLVHVYFLLPFFVDLSGAAVTRSMQVQV